MKAPQKITELFWKLIKFLIALFSVWFIWKSITEHSGTAELTGLLQEIWFQDGNIPVVILLVILVGINWGLESLKWRYLLKPVASLSFWTAIKAILSGTTVSLFTPNRTGEFAGRVLFLEREHRLKGIFATITGSFAQLMVTIVIGGLCYWQVKEIMPDYWRQFIIYADILMILLPLAGITVFLFLPTIIRKLPESKVRKLLNIITRYHNKELLTVLGYSALRYLVFTTQFYLALHLFGLEAAPLHAMVLIGFMYLVMTIVPTLAIAEIAVRGSVAIYFFNPYMDQSVSIVAATTLIWLINLAFPALLGVVAIVTLKKA